MSSCDVFGMAVHDTSDHVLPGTQLSSQKFVVGFGVLSAVAGITAVSFEFADWWVAQTAWKTSYTLETDVEGPRRLLMDITFPNLECGAVDLKDNAKSTKWTREAGILETSVVEKYVVGLDGVETLYEEPAQSQCLPCYEASSGSSELCCNTCQGLVEAFFAQGILKGQDFSKYPQCQRGGCRIKTSVVISGEYGLLWYVPTRMNLQSTRFTGANPNVLLAQQWSIAHTINSASLTPIIGGPQEPVSLNIPNMGEKVELSTHQVTYNALVVPTELRTPGSITRSHRNRVHTTTRQAISAEGDKVTQDCTPGFRFVVRTQVFGMRLTQDPPSIMNLFNRLIVCVGGMLVFFDFVCMLFRRCTRTLPSTLQVERLSSLSSSLSKAICHPPSRDSVGSTITDVSETTSDLLWDSEEI